jgi:hypothetical protein
MTARAIDLRVASGRWLSLHHCTYAMAGAPQVWEQLATAAHLWAGPGAALSRLTAAAILGLRSDHPLVVDVTTTRKIKTNGVRVHRTQLARSDEMKVAGFPVTTPSRTLIDLASVLDEGRLESCLEQALYLRLFRLSEMQSRIVEVGCRGRKGAGVLQELLELRDSVDAPTESDMETLLIRVLRKARMPIPRRQYEVWDGSQLVTGLDFAFPDELLGIPADSYRWHGTRTQWEKDIEQRNRALALGWRLRPTTWAELTRRPERFVGDLGRLLNRSAA